MYWVNIIIITIMAGYVWGGFWTGLIQSVGGVVGLFLGVLVASRAYESAASFLSPVFGGNEMGSQVFSFILVFMLVTRLVGLAFYGVNKIFNFFAIVPGMKLLNRLGGALFGLIEGALFVGITLQFVSRLPITDNFAEYLATAPLPSFCLAISGWLVPLFPGFLKEAENMVSKYLPK